MQILSRKILSAAAATKTQALVSARNQLHATKNLVFNFRNNSKQNINAAHRRNLRYGNLGGKINTSGTTLLLSPAEATKILRTNEATVDLETKCSLKYYDVNYLGSNSPPEDRQTQAKYLHSDIYLFGVFDGHGGYYCSDAVSQRLFDYIALNFLGTKQLEDKLKWNLTNTYKQSDYPLWFAYQSTYKDSRSQILKELHKQSLRYYAEELLKEKVMEESVSDGAHSETVIDIEKILTNAFIKLDNDLTLEALPNPAQGKTLDRETMDVAMSGACACVALVSGKELYVANCGDARAVIGQENDDGTFSPFQMSFEHNAENVEEVQRLFNEHPNEAQTMIRDGRLLEMLLPFRAFGDIRFKWSAKYLRDYTVPVYGHGVIPSHYYTPPYVTARPDVIKRKLNYRDKFLILATDGLWDLLTPERVVQLVGNHLNGQQSYDPYLLPDDRSIALREMFEDLTKRRVAISHQPIDHNSATHLIRNALGNDHITLSNYLRADVPRSIRDDITITVVYFDTDYIIDSYK